MISLPKVKSCPCCGATNIITINDKLYRNEFKTLKNWDLRKRFFCRKCKEEMGLFIKEFESIRKEKLLWINDLICEDKYYDKLNKLNEKKSKLRKVRNTKYFEIDKEVNNIQKQIQAEKIKLKIKLKIQKRAALIT